jgi:thiosulfate dehydrogenase
MRTFLLGFLLGLLTLPLLAFAIAWYGLFSVHASASPSFLESSLAQLALSRAAARRAPHLQNPIPPTEENLMAGVKLFKNDCAGCHGTPYTPVQRPPILYPDAPNFALAPPDKPDYQLFWLVKGGIRYSGMFAWGGQFGKDASGRDVSDDRIWTVVTFLTHLRSLPPAVDVEWHKKSSD